MKSIGMNKMVVMLRSMRQYEICHALIKRSFFRTYTNSTSQNIREQNPSTYESVPKFYAGQSVFITGGTGFIGKVVVEKLLRSCPDIKTIYLLIRANSELHAKQRVQETVNGSVELFSRLKKENPENIAKIVPIVGEFGKPNLGIKTKDEERLLNNVSIIIHLAATTKLNEIPKVAVQYNFEGTREILKLSQRMKNIKAFLHISTLYCAASTDRKYIDETVNTPSIDYKKVLEHANKNDKNCWLKYGYGNTYLMTKALAENIVNEEHGNVPTAILRPSMVQCSKSEPFEGWIDSMSLLSFYALSMAKGHMRVLMGDNETIADIIPVDYVANMIIVAAARCKKTKHVDVYNCGSSFCNPLKLSELCKSSTECGVKYGYDAVPYPNVVLTRSKLLFNILVATTEFLPAYIYDFLLQIQGKPKRFLKSQKRVMNLRNDSMYFTENTWKAKVDKARELYQSLDNKDRLDFPCDPNQISWKEYLPVNLRGIFNIPKKTE